MTNGEKIKEIFPDIEFTDMAFTVHAVAEVTSNGVKGHISYDFWKSWWNAEYKEPTAKNDLAVDCISRADARSLVVKIDRKYMFGMSGKAFQDLYKGIDELPSVTPQEPTTNFNIPFLMHKELDIPISECQKAYNVAIEYLKSTVRVKG